MGSGTEGASDGSDMNPGDEVPPGTPGSGEDVCPECGGSGKRGQAPCVSCGGTGRVTRGVGGG